jgi:polysaccharide export outer membrane protein
MPGVGEIKAAGLTVAELSSQTQGLYTTLKRPDLTVQVRSFANRKVFVGGEVLRPGPLMILGPKTVAEAIIESGGMKESARRGSVVLIRRTKDGTPAKFDIPTTWKGNGPKTTNVALEPYDVVLVTESGISKADRAVDQYIRRLIPGLVTGGFTYLFGPGVGVVPQ